MDALERRFTVDAGTLTYARIAIFYYPHWKATLNGEPLGISAADDGTILVQLPNEQATVSLVFEEPAVNRGAGLLSFFAFALVLIFFAFELMKRWIRIQKADA